VVSALLRLAVGWGNGLCLGESYYFSCARHPSLSYHDHPPLSMLLGTLSMQLSGNAGRLVLRWPIIVLFAGTTWLMFLLGRRLFGAWAGFHAALLLNLSPIFSLTVGVFFQPEGTLMFFSLACVWCLAHLLLGPPPRRPLAWWAAAGLMLGLAMLSKYAAVLLVAGAGLHVLTSREQRRWLAHPGPYLALAIALLLFSPVLVWNAQHQWESFIFQTTRGAQEFDRIHLDWVLFNIGGQALGLLPWIWAALVVELATSFGRRPPQPQRRFVAWLAVLPIVLFTGVAAYAAVSLRHFHWPTPGYLLLFLPLGDTVSRGLARGSPVYRWSLRATAVVSLVSMAVVTTHIATGWLKDLPGLAKRFPAVEDPVDATDPTFECVDYTGLERAFAERGLLGRKDIFVFSDWWLLAGKIDYGLKGRLPVFAFTRNGTPRAFAYFDRSERWLGKDGIFVTTKTPAEVAARFGPYFTRITPLGQVDVGRAGRPEAKLNLYRCEGLLIPYPQPYG
jgi:dolichyl-phosphate-mannose-protein mannosyltransferase